MVCEITKDIDRSPLLPDRQEQGDFFVCDIFDAAPKGDMASMAHPIFSLSTKPDHRVRRYEDETGKNYLEVKPSADGLATIHDRDVLIYCISQIMAALNKGQKVSRTVRLTAFDMLKATNRATDGRGYEGLKSALTRLQGTQIETNIVTGETEQLDIFSIIDRARIVRETRDGRMQEIEIQLSDWVFNAIEAHEVLTLHRNYFRLRKPLERRIYEIARKHCGQQKEWKISLGALQRKCGSASTPREFKRLVNNIVAQDKEHDHMPDYAVRLVDDMVHFINRGSLSATPALSDEITFHLDPETHQKARRVAPGWDVYVLEREWREWMTEPPRNPDAAFIGFCKKVFEKRGRP
ncbi:plasmid replication initiator TrfA [Roseovarius amoyensis]|uniref:plasmid replication initiator TrfA n=1 Tax=Roseovarius amoyensis TaxID=2211448 RepID=UPI000DBEA4FD|nr:replication initiator protein A [Roseovarius amoyensis]